MPLGDPRGSKSDPSRYCGVDSEFDEDVSNLLSLSIHGGFDFLLLTLIDPEYRPSLLDNDNRVSSCLPFAGSDLVLSPAQWSSHVVGKISSWIDLDSEDEVVRKDSEIALKQEIAWASHLSLQACLLPTPKGVSCANYAKCVNQIIQNLNGMQLWLRIPLEKSMEHVEFRDPDHMGKGHVDSWELWNTFRHLCEHHSQISVALDILPSLPSASSLERWFGEPVRAAIINTNSFLTNALGYPCLSKQHQRLSMAFFNHSVQVVISGKPVHNGPMVAAISDSNNIDGAWRHPLRPYLDYIAHLYQKMDPLSEQESFEVGYRDYLQSPLQPLMDNLEAQTYETFEKDTVKYSQFSLIRMKDSTSPKADFISSLPYCVIENILGCLPLRDVVRTSILSREWRYKWVTCPEVGFDFWFDQMFLGAHKLDSVVYQILKLHKGPLLKFALQVPDLRSSPQIDEWIHLLPSNTLQDLILHVSRGDSHKLPSRIFTFQNLRSLKLYNCAFLPPSNFMGFGKLKNLDLQNVSLVTEEFGKFTSSCPAIERMRLVHCTSFDCLEVACPNLKYLEFHGVFKSISFEKCFLLSDIKISFSSMDFKRGNCFSIDLVQSLGSLPALEDLQLQAYALEDLVEYGAPKKLPIALEMLKNLHISDLYFEKIEEISCALCFIRSCPNLLKLKITAFTSDVVDSVAEFLRSQNNSDSLTHLKTIKMQLFSGIESEMEFVKHLLASAVELEEMAIASHAGTVSDGGESILNELKQFPRASRKAEIVNLDKKK